MPESSQHWERVYAGKSPQAVSWFEEDPAPSLEMIEAAGVDQRARIIDVGAGAAMLVDRLLALGFARLTVLDIASRPLELSMKRLGPRAAEVEWLTQDVTRWTPRANAYDLWHDRAVFHFLTHEADRANYLRALNRGLAAGGHLVLACFAPSGPEVCSGLPVRRYSAQELQQVLGANFQLVRHAPQTHRTPAGASQDFTWCLFQKMGEDA